MKTIRCILRRIQVRAQHTLRSSEAVPAMTMAIAMAMAMVVTLPSVTLLRNLARSSAIYLSLKTTDRCVCVRPINSDPSLSYLCVSRISRGNSRAFCLFYLPHLSFSHGRIGRDTTLTWRCSRGPTGFSASWRITIGCRRNTWICFGRRG